MPRLFRRVGDPTDRLWVELPVTPGDIARGANTVTPGMKLFSGLWYGRDPTKASSYGKMVEIDYAVPVGVVTRNTPRVLLRRLGAVIDYRARPALVMDDTLQTAQYARRKTPNRKVA